MAQRYGGKHSPQTDEPRVEAKTPHLPKFRDRRASNVSLWARLMFFAPLPLLFAGIGEIRRADDPLSVIIELGGFAALMLAAWLLNEGIRAEQAYDARKVAKPPSFPRKLVSAGIVGVTVALVVASANQSGLLAGIPFGIVATAAHVLGFGLDPMRRKGLEGVNEFETERIAAAVEKAEGIVAQIKDAARRIGDRRLEARIDRLCESARQVFRAVEEDPRDLPRARKFMTVYLMGARDATAKFADVYRNSSNAEARADYEALLTDLETSFSKHREELLLEDRSDLDIEIEVLRERLKQEGLTA